LSEGTQGTFFNGLTPLKCRSMESAVNKIQRQGDQDQMHRNMHET